MRSLPQHNRIWPWALLPARTLLFAAWQGVFALAFFLTGSPAAWNPGAAWWPFTVTLTNCICIAILITLYQREGQRYRDLFRVQREHLKHDMLTMLGIVAISAPIAFLPNILGAAWLFGDPQTPVGLLFQPLPTWAIWAALVLFPITQGLAEIPTYMAYIMPRLEVQTKERWASLILPAFFLGAQHIAVPLLFEGRFIIWRLIMFMPFAFLVALVMRRRPRLLPYLAIVHVLMDVSAVAMYFAS